MFQEAKDNCLCVVGVRVGMKVDVLGYSVTVEINNCNSIMIDGNRKCNRKAEGCLIQHKKNEERCWA